MSVTGSATPREDRVQSMRLEALGQCRIRVGNAELRPEHERAFGLAVRLIMAGGMPVSREALTDLLWPGSRADSRRQSLRQLVYRLRQLRAPMVASPGDLRVDMAWCEQDATLPDATGLVQASPGRIQLLTQPWLPGWEPRWSAAMRDWLEETRAEVAGRVRVVLARALPLAREAGRWEQVEVLARGLLRTDPLHDGATMALAEALAATGSKATALDMLDAYAAEVGRRRRDLALAPSLLRRRLSEQVSGPGASPAEPPLRGRDAEMGRLVSALDRTVDGDGTTHVIVGEAGIGKTRLLQELATAAGRMGVGVVRHVGTGQSALEGFGAIAGLARGLEERPGALGASPEHLSLLRALSGRRAATAPGDVTAAGPTLAALRDLLTAVAHEGPVVMLVDDFHLLDPGSQAVLGMLAHDTARLPLVFVLASRPHTSVWLEGASEHLGVMVLRPLDAAAARACALDASARAGLAWDEEALEECVALSGGHPRLTSALVAQWPGRLSGDGQPAALADLLRQRVQGLADGALRLLQSVSVLGRFATLDRLVAMTAAPPQDLVSQLASLDERGLLTGPASSPRVRHALLGETALDLLPARARGALHGFAARQVLEEATAGTSAEAVVDCATHFARAGERGRAAEVLRREAERLAGRGGAGGVARLLPIALREIQGTAEAKDVFRLLLQASALSGAYAEGFAALRTLTSPEAGPVVPLRTLGPAALRVASQASDAWTTWVAEAEAQLADASLPDDDRLGAALEGLRMAHGLHDAGAMRRVYRDSRDPAARNRGSFTTVALDIAYHTDHGELEVAVRAADDLIRLTGSGSDPGRRFEALCLGTAPPFRVGDLGLAVSRLRQAMAIAEREGLAQRMLAPVLELWDLGLHLGDDALVAEMSAIAARGLGDHQAPAGAALLGSFEVLTHVFCRHVLPRDARPENLRLSVVTAHPVVRVRLRQLSSYVLHCVQTKRRPGARALEALAHDSEALLPFGGMDVPVAARLAASLADSRIEEGRGLLTRYLTVRRDRGPVHVGLARYADQLR